MWSLSVDSVLWWTGAVVWMCVALLLIWLVIEILVGFACAVSWCHWSYRLMTLHGRKHVWRGLPKTFWRRWIELSGHRNNGDTSWSGTGGYWRGIGDWKAFPPTPAVEGSHHAD